MSTTATFEWFADDDDRRSVLFAIAMGTGFLSIVAGVSTLTATSAAVIGGALFVLGLAVFGLATVIAAGTLDPYLFAHTDP